MTDPDIIEALASVSLPEGYEWGPWIGAYRRVQREDQTICCVGGVSALVDPDGMQIETLRAITKGEMERARA